MKSFSLPIQPDAEALVANLRREGTPPRVHYMELFLDGEIKEAICERFDLFDGLDRSAADFDRQREIRVQRFLGYDHVYAAIPLAMPNHRLVTADTADLAHRGGRSFVDEHRGPITNWDEFEQYPWPDPHAASDEALAWYQQNLPDDMCVIPNSGAHFCEHLCWLMGYETLCVALYDQRDLVRAIADRVADNLRVILSRVLQFDCVKAVWGSDDMGFKTATMISPADLREFVLPGHQMAAEMCHAAGRPYLLHACGNLREVISELIDEVKIDAKHSFEDTIERVTDAKREYGDRCTLLGGIDVDFLCRADEPAIRRRVRETLDVCLPGGGYCMGSGNSVANYVPVDHYLAMLDESRRYTG